MQFGHASVAGCWRVLLQASNLSRGVIFAGQIFPSLLDRIRGLARPFDPNCGRPFGRGLPMFLVFSSLSGQFASSPEDLSANMTEGCGDRFRDAYD